MNKWKGAYFNLSIHILIWVLLLAIPSIIFRGETRRYLGLSHNFFLLVSVYHIGIFYLNAYFLYPLFVTRQRWWLYIPVLAAIMVVSYYSKIFLLQFDPAFEKTHENSRAILFGMLPFIIASTIFRLISDRIRFERLEKEARAERLGAELKFLRSQVSPHFLFNMMANMVSLARQKSVLLEPSLIKLSELLRYMLYDSGDEQISLDKEIDHLQNYIDMQQLRFGEDVSINTRINNNCRDCMIEPMLLVPFIENAFKHGIGIVKDPFIRVELHAAHKKLAFTIMNNYSRESSSKDKNSGIGLSNVKNRLELLYHGRYRLDISEDNNLFTVHLNLELS